MLDPWLELLACLRNSDFYTVSATISAQVPEPVPAE